MSGDMFTDENLALAVVHSLLESGLIPGGYQQDLESPVYAEMIRNWGPRDDEDMEPDEDIEEFRERRFAGKMRDAFLAMLVTHRDQVPLLQHLQWSGHAQLLRSVEPGWRGRDTRYDVTDLDGIERCVALHTVSSSAMLRPRDLEPLTRLPALRSIRLGLGWPGEDTYYGYVPPYTVDWRPLLRIPSLRLVGGPVETTVAAQLADRGVRLEIPPRPPPAR